MKGPGLMVVVGKGKPKHSMSMGDEMKMDEGDDDEYDLNDGYKSAAEDVISAVKKGDPEMLAESLKEFVSMCMNGDDDEGDEPY